MVASPAPAKKAKRVPFYKKWWNAVKAEWAKRPKPKKVRPAAWIISGLVLLFLVVVVVLWGPLGGGTPSSPSPTATMPPAPPPTATMPAPTHTPTFDPSTCPNPDSSGRPLNWTASEQSVGCTYDVLPTVTPPPTQTPSPSATLGTSPTAGPSPSPTPGAFVAVIDPFPKTAQEFYDLVARPCPTTTVEPDCVPLRLVEVVPITDTGQVIGFSVTRERRATDNVVPWFYIHNPWGMMQFGYMHSLVDRQTLGLKIDEVELLGYMPNHVGAGVPGMWQGPVEGITFYNDQVKDLGRLGASRQTAADRRIVVP